MASTKCPVCGFDLGVPAWTGDMASFEICQSCGLQFGYDDAAGGDRAARGAVHERWRAEWIRKGMRWWSSSTPPPSGWDPGEQLARITGSKERDADR